MEETVSNCKNCTGNCKAQIFMPCEVCTLVHDDTSVKLVYYCDLCSAYICCAKCKGDLPNRALAATMKAVISFKEVLTKRKEK